VNIKDYLSKYNFETSGKQIDRLQKYYLSLKQEDFDKRGFLEMLHFATMKLKRNMFHHEESEINIHKDEFTHLFTISGDEIRNLSEISRDTKILVCSTSK
jgi:hypothetical protein